MTNEMPDKLYVMKASRGYIGSPHQTEDEDVKYIREDKAIFLAHYRKVLAENEQFREALEYLSDPAKYDNTVTRYAIAALNIRDSA